MADKPLSIKDQLRKEEEKTENENIEESGVVNARFLGTHKEEDEIA